MSASTSALSSYKFTVNGQAQSVSVPADMPLLWVLRDIVKLTGTKYGCGIGLCGACTVHLDGQAIRSCSVPVSAVQGKKVTTIEGLSESGDHPLQKLWQELNVSQCGFCQAGQIMNAAAWMKNKKQITDADIDSQQAGNVCRCASYNRIREAIKLAVNVGEAK